MSVSAAISLPGNIVGATDKDTVYVLLDRAMNGLRSAPLAWYQELSGHLKDLGFSGGVDPTIFRKGAFG